jgi:DNA-binding CsgD family transcriptional regulator
VLVVQERLRFYRESMTACLRRQLDGIEVGPGASSAAELVEMAGSNPLTHGVIEADAVPWDVPALVATLHRHHPGLQLIGLFTSTRPVSCDGVVLVPRNAAPEQIAQLIQPGSDRPAPFVLTATANSDRGPLTAQQLRVLALLSLGFNGADVATRLGLSERGVTKSKTAIFAKLGAQSQAQAVANALAAGLLGPSSPPLNESDPLP